MNEPTMGDIKRFARKVYLFCTIALIGGALLVNSFRGRENIWETILLITGVLIIVLAVVMLAFFLNFFRKVRKKMQAESERGDNHSVD